MLKKNKKFLGFSLLEMSIVLIVASFFMTTIMNTIPMMMNSYKRYQGIQKLEKIQMAIESYIYKNEKLPYPSKIDINMENNLNEAVNPNTGINATNGLLIGGLPTKVLGLSPDYMLDIWGNKFIYIVSKDFADQKLSDTNSEIFIKINHSKMDNQATIIDTAIYSVISSGRKGIGAHKKNGQIQKHCSSSCKNRVGHITGTIYEENNDDKIIYGSKNVLNYQLFFHRDCEPNTATNLSEMVKLNCDNNEILDFSDSLNGKMKFKDKKTILTYNDPEDTTINKQCITECSNFGQIIIYNVINKTN